MTHSGEAERFAILDDYRFGWEELFDHFVCTNLNYDFGLEDDHVAKVIELLNL